MNEGTGRSAEPEPATPAAEWRAKGEPDPHGTHYDCERAALVMGDLTDDELANAVFMHGDSKPRIEDVIAGLAHRPIAYLTAAKDRIRWLSRALERALSEPEPVRAALAERITAYLSGGGLFNPELANHDAVRDLLIDCRRALAQSPSGTP